MLRPFRPYPPLPTPAVRFPLPVPDRSSFRSLSFISSEHFDKIHGIWSLVMTSVVVLQVLCAVFRPHPPPKGLPNMAQHPTGEVVSNRGRKGKSQKLYSSYVFFSPCDILKKEQFGSKKSARTLAQNLQHA